MNLKFLALSYPSFSTDKVLSACYNMQMSFSYNLGVKLAISIALQI
jgi:hypothetical protein